MMSPEATPGPQLERADAAYHQGDFEAALRLYLDALASLGASSKPSASRARALAGSGNCYEPLGYKGKAVSFWHRAIEEYRRCGQAESPAVAQLENAIESYERYPIVFISYARKDDARVTALERHLTSLECRLVRDVHDFRPGADLQNEIARKMDKCPNYLVLWSRAYAERAFTQFELEIILRVTDPLSPERVPGRRAIIAALDDEPLPRQLFNQLMIAWNGRTDEALAEEIHHALTGKRELR